MEIGMNSDDASAGTKAFNVDLPYDPVTFAFKDIWYTVKLRGGEELDLLRGVSGAATG
jgi:hypothetical protein